MNIKEYQRKADEFAAEARSLGYRKVKAKDSEDYALRRKVDDGLYLVISGTSWMAWHDVSLKLETAGRWGLLMVDLSDLDIRRAERELMEHARARNIALDMEVTA